MELTKQIDLINQLQSELYSKRLEYEYQIENFEEGSIEKEVMKARFNAIYEAEDILNGILGGKNIDPENQSRKKAIIWWNKREDIYKKILCDTFLEMEDRNASILTGREIEIIYNKAKKIFPI